MASGQTEAYFIGGTAITLGALGASIFPTIISSPASSGGQLKILTLGSGATVQILPLAVSGASIGGATATGASITGYPLGTTEIYSWLGPARFYLANTTAASVVSVAFKYGGAGATLA